MKYPSVCKVCKSQNLKILVDFGEQPVAHNLLEDASQPDIITHPLTLHICLDCSMVQIMHPLPPEKLYKNFNFCFGSWKPPHHASAEVKLLKQFPSITTALEIGCNDGLFLDILTKNNIKSEGVEPNPHAALLARNNGHVVHEAFFTKEFAAEFLAQSTKKFDLIAARHVLEHVDNTDDFFEAIGLLLADEGIVLFEVPDIQPALTVGDCSAIWEEEPSYFTEATLVTLLSRYGYSPLIIERFQYSGGALMVLAKKDTMGRQKVTYDFKEIVEQHLTYRNKIEKYKEFASHTLSAYKRSSGNVIMYGAGCSACTWINTLNMKQVIDVCVDDQQEKQNKYLPGSRLLIRPLEDLSIEKKDKLLFLLAVNNENEEKVTAKIQKYYPNSEYLSIRSPKNIYDCMLNFASRNTHAL